MYCPSFRRYVHSFDMSNFPKTVIGTSEGPDPDCPQTLDQLTSDRRSRKHSERHTLLCTSHLFNFVEEIKIGEGRQVAKQDRNYVELNFAGARNLNRDEKISHGKIKGSSTN